jgi:hypothetical protein
VGAQEVAEMVITLFALWFIWTERNIIREEGHRQSAEVLTRVSTYIHENAKPASRKPIDAAWTVTSNI